MTLALLAVERAILVSALLSLMPSGLHAAPPATPGSALATPAAAVAAPAPPLATPAAASEATAIRVLLAPELETTLTAQMPGRIAAINGSLGSTVQKGKTVVALDCSEAVARLRMAEAELASAKETLNAKKQLKALDAAGETEVTLATAAADKARAQIGVARAQTGQCAAVAPFSGRIARLYVKPHQGVNPGNPLVDLVSDGPLKLRLNVPSLLLRSLKTGARFEVSIDETGKTYPARVSAINARVDAVAQSVELEGHIEGSHPELLPGMSGSARFVGGT